MIAELKSPNFNKYNCVALLNTFYFIDEKPINSHMNAQVIAAQRAALWKYITSVESSGVQILDSVCQSHGGWEAVSNNTDMYCRVALDLIQRAEELGRPVSYGSYVSEASSNERNNSIELDCALTETSRRGSQQGVSDSEQEGPGKKSTLEKIVRGLQKLSTKTSRRNFYSPEYSSSNEDMKTRGYTI